MIYNESYTIIFKIIPGSCTNVFPGHKGANNFLWFISRGMTDYFWMYPFIYVFWPRAVKMDMRTVSSNSQTTTDIEVVTVYDENDSDDEIESMYPQTSGGLRSWGNMRSFVRSYTYSVHQTESEPAKSGRPVSGILNRNSARLSKELEKESTGLTSCKKASVNPEKENTTEDSQRQSMDSLDRDIMQNFLMNNPSSNTKEKLLSNDENDEASLKTLEFVY